MVTICASFPLSVPPDMTIAAFFAARLAMLMQEQGETQSSLTRDGKLPFTQQQISALLAGRHVPGGAILVAVAKHFDVSADWLLGLSPERKRQHDHAVGFVDDDVLRRFLNDDPTLSRSARIAVEFPPTARLVDRAEFDRILRDTGADATPPPGKKRLPWRRRGR